jgi:hypothetical protein
MAEASPNRRRPFAGAAIIHIINSGLLLGWPQCYLTE